ncbi:MAG: helix-turn-helix domain-containing protein [Chloroflexota bacterium]|nr:helix-turn-helix domain-containing protein [Chloroflexota bacterium]
MLFGEEIRVLRDPEVLRLIADPLRLRMLELLRQQARTVTELATLLDTPRTKLYYHIRLLESHDLVTVESSEIVSGITEKRYRATAYRLTVDKALLGSRADDSSPLEAYLSFIVDEVAGEIRRAVDAGLIDLDETHEDAIRPRRLVIGRKWYRFSGDDVTEFRRRVSELHQAFEARAVFGTHGEEEDPDLDRQLYEWLIGFYPVLPPEAPSDE